MNPKQLIAALLVVLTANVYGFAPAAHAAISPGQEQRSAESIRAEKETASRVETPKSQAQIEVGETAVSDEKMAAAIAAAEDGTSARGGDAEGVAVAASFLSESSEQITVVLKSIQVPDDAPISRYEMEALIKEFEGRQSKLSDIIYLTENVAQLYRSAETISDLTSYKEGFADESEASSPTIFTIDKINVPDDAAISKEEVEALVKPYEGRSLTLSELRNFARNVDRIYLSSENILAIAEGSYQPYAVSAGGARKSGVAARRAKAAKEAADAGLPAQDVPFLINKIEIAGNSVVPTEELRSIVSSHEGKQLKLSDAKQIALSITQHYRAKGYITCRAYIPPQKLSDGVLKIQVLEGKLGRLKVQGNRYFKNDNIKRYLNKIKGKVLRYEELQKELTRANLHPDRDVKAVIVPGKAVGTSDLVLDVSDRQPFHFGGEINNFGTKLTGRERYSFHARHTNLTGIDDILAIRTQFGEEVLALGAQYAVPVGAYDTQIGATFNYTDVSVGGEFSILDIGGEAFAYSAFVNQPVYDGQYFDLTWTNSFEVKSIDNTILGATSSEDELRIAHTGLNIDEVDPYGRTFIVNDFAFGTPWLGASEKHDSRLSRADAGASFFKYTGALNRIHPVYDSTYLMLKGAVQVSPDKLVSAEQFDLGGVYSVRGYPQSDYLGDYGVSGSAELRVPFYFIPRDVKAPWSGVPLWNRLNFIAFIDGGHAALRNPAVGEFGSRNYAGLGGGLRFDLPQNWVGRFEWASAVGDDPIDGSNGQFYFSVSGDLI